MKFSGLTHFQRVIGRRISLGRYDCLILECGHIVPMQDFPVIACKACWLASKSRVA
jgi:hypothetical protein